MPLVNSTKATNKSASKLSLLAKRKRRIEEYVVCIHDMFYETGFIGITEYLCLREVERMLAWEASARRELEFPEAALDEWRDLKRELALD